MMSSTVGRLSSLVVPLWNTTWEPDMSGSRALTQDKIERPDMSGLGAGHVQETSLKPGSGAR
jgi:hypothetical protein